MEKNKLRGNKMTHLQFGENPEKELELIRRMMKSKDRNPNGIAALQYLEEILIKRIKEKT